MIAKYINEHRIETAKPQMFQHDGTTYFGGTVPDEALLANGWLPLVEEEEPEPRAGFHAEPRYAVEDGRIVQTWVEVAIQPAPIMISKSKVEAVVDAMGKTATFVGWLQSSARYFGAWMRSGDAIAYDPQDNESDLASLIAALGIEPDDVAALIEQVREGE